MVKLVTFYTLFVLTLIGIAIFWIYYGCTYIGFPRMGCPIPESGTDQFLFGSWHASIAIFSAIGMCLKDTTITSIYSMMPHSVWYDFGYLLSMGGLGFLSSRKSKATQ